MFWFVFDHEETEYHCVNQVAKSTCHEPSFWLKQNPQQNTVVFSGWPVESPGKGTEHGNHHEKAEASRAVRRGAKTKAAENPTY